eukprot:1205178-Rhodomonas_salina.1
METAGLRWWILEAGHPDPHCPGQYLFEGAIHELGGQRPYYMQADQLQHVLECAREAPPTLEVKGTDAEL